MANPQRKMNESDVREDVAMPLLQALGYASGTKNNIIREQTLAYPNNFIGRKKKTDPPLRGRADYILTVLGAGSWTLEIKAEDIEIDRDAIEQAITYAQHPQVAGSYAALLNGKRFIAFHNTQRSDALPLIDLPVESVAQLAMALDGTLSPSAIRRDCSPPKVDLEMPLAKGLRSSARISKASILYGKFNWGANAPITAGASTILEDICRRMSGLRVSASGGWIRRDGKSRIIAQLDWIFPSDDLKRFAEQKQVADIQYVCLSPVLSEDPNFPTVFHVTGKYKIDVGDNLFDVAKWETTVAGIDATMAFSGQAAGFLKSGVFRGFVRAKHEMTFPSMPSLEVVYSGTGQLDISIVD